MDSDRSSVPESMKTTSDRAVLAGKTKSAATGPDEMELCSEGFESVLLIVGDFAATGEVKISGVDIRFRSGLPSTGKRKLF